MTIILMQSSAFYLRVLTKIKTMLKGARKKVVKLTLQKS